MKTLVVGLGNPILGDDGVGWRVAEKVKNQISRSAEVDVDCLSLGGISLMEHLIGYERAILVDAFASDSEPGLIRVSELAAIPDYSAFHIASAHDTSLQNALKLGRGIGAVLPEEIIVVGIATSHVYDFSEELSSPVAAAVPRASAIVADLVMQKITVH